MTGPRPAPYPVKRTGLNPSLMRAGLILTAVWLAAYNGLARVRGLLAMSTAELGPVPTFMEELGAFFTGLPLVFILLWAAHNLKPLFGADDAFMADILRGILIVASVALIVSIAVYVRQSMTYLPNIDGGQFRALVSALTWLPYTVAELVLLAFAARQMRLKSEARVMAGAVS